MRSSKARFPAQITLLTRTPLPTYMRETGGTQTMQFARKPILYRPPSASTIARAFALRDKYQSDVEAHEVMTEINAFEHQTGGTSEVVPFPRDLDIDITRHYEAPSPINGKRGGSAIVGTSHWLIHDAPSQLQALRRKPLRESIPFSVPSHGGGGIGIPIVLDHVVGPRGMAQREFEAHQAQLRDHEEQVCIEGLRRRCFASHRGRVTKPMLKRAPQVPGETRQPVIVDAEEEQVMAALDRYDYELQRQRRAEKLELAERPASRRQSGGTGAAAV